MTTVAKFESDFESWRKEARRLLQLQIKPFEIEWSQSEGNLSLFENFEANNISPPVAADKEHDKEHYKEQRPQTKISVTREFLEMAELVACARDSDRWSLLYRLLYRIHFENPKLLQIVIDPDVHKALGLMKSIRKDIHKMHAFVRFKKAAVNGLDIYLAWHRSEHFILRLTAGFFVRRFGDRPWSIFTPDLSAHWDGEIVKYADGIEQHEFPHTDSFDDLWKTYYSSIFNPARIKIKAMKAELPTKYWQSLPEAQIIQQLVREAPARLQRMAQNQNHRAQVPKTENWQQLKAAALNCNGCPLRQQATHLVFGEGPEQSELMIVGEQPGDSEDLQGRPFVGPAGQLLDECLKTAGLNREHIYLTNAVKHFKWKPVETGNGKMRLHQKPSGSEMHACKPWLEAEITSVKPRVILALGATAATSIRGRLPKISEERGQIFHNSPLASFVLLSWHPSAILRSSTAQEAAERKLQLIADLRLAASCLAPAVIDVP